MFASILGAGKGERMGELIIVFWRDIPAQIIVRKGRQSARQELSARFAEAIDMAAMRGGAAGADDYLADWRKSDAQPVSDDLEAEADRAATLIEAEYDKDRLAALVHAKGWHDV